MPRTEGANEKVSLVAFPRASLTPLAAALERPVGRQLLGKLAIESEPGEAGIGKSRILRALRDSLEGQGAAPWQSPYFTSTALYPLVDSLGRRGHQPISEGGCDSGIERSARPELGGTYADPGSVADLVHAIKEVHDAEPELDLAEAGREVPTDTHIDLPIRR